MMLPWDLEFFADAGEHLRASLQFDPIDGLLRPVVRNTGDEPRALGDVVLEAEPGWNIGSGQIWIHGRRAGHDTRIHPFGEPEADEVGQPFVSEMVVGIELPRAGDRALVFGTVDETRFRTDIQLLANSDETAIRMLTVVIHGEGIVLGPGERLELPAVWVASGTEVWPLLEAYAAFSGEHLAARTEAPALVSAHIAGTPAEAIAALESVSPLADVVVYTPATDQADGLALVASAIVARDMRPGLALAPMSCSDADPAVVEHPELVLVGPDGQAVVAGPDSDRRVLLDYGRPEALELLRARIHRAVHEDGFTYLLLDGLDDAGQPANEVAYHAPGTTGAAHIRAALSAVREAAGEEAFLLARGGDFGAAVGLVDAMAVDGAVPGTDDPLGILERAWMHRRWWVNHSGDQAVTDAVDAPTARCWATVTAIGGGGHVTSPVTAASAIAPAPDAAARPLDADETPEPTAWRAELADGRALVAVFNWDDTRVWASPSAWLRPGEVAFNFWEQSLSTGDVLLEPGDVVLWQVTGPSRGPRVVGDTGHVAFAGLEIRAVSGQVHVRNTGAAARYIALDIKGSVRFELLEPGQLGRYW